MIRPPLRDEKDKDFDALKGRKQNADAVSCCIGFL